MRRSLRIGLVAAGLLLALSSGTVLGAQPNNQACLGHDFSAFAQAEGRELGQDIARDATTAPGYLGTAIQLLLAGEVPDEVFPNACND